MAVRLKINELFLEYFALQIYKELESNLEITSESISLVEGIFSTFISTFCFE